MGLRDQTHCQLRLGTDGIKTGRIQNHQSLLEQGMGNVDQRVTPPWHFDKSIRSDQGVVRCVLVVPETQRSGLVLSDVSNFGHFLQRLCELRGVIDVQIDTGPLFWNRSPLHKRLSLQPGFNR